MLDIKIMGSTALLYTMSTPCGWWGPRFLYSVKHMGKALSSPPVSINSQHIALSN